MNLPPLHTLSISAFTPKAELPTDDEFLQLPDWRTPRVGWRENMLRFLVNRARADGTEFSNASGVVFDENMLFSQAGHNHHFAPVSCTAEEHKVFAEVDYYAEEGGLELYRKHLTDSGVGAVFQMLEDGGPDMTVERAIAKATPQPERLKLLFELLNGKVTAPHSQEPIDVLEQKLHAVSGMRDPTFVNPEANNKTGNATNTGFAYRTLQASRDLFVDNGTITRSFFSNSAIKECCIGSRGEELPFRIGSTVRPYTDNDYGALDVMDIRTGQQATFVTLNSVLSFDSASELVGQMIHNKGQVYTSMSPRWTFEPEGFNAATDTPLATYALRVTGPAKLRCTIQEPRSNYVDMALLTTEKDPDSPTLDISTALLPIVILPAMMAFEVDNVVVDEATNKQVVFATYIPYDEDDKEHFPKRPKSDAKPPQIITLSDCDDD